MTVIEIIILIFAAAATFLFAFVALDLIMQQLDHYFPNWDKHFPW